MTTSFKTCLSPEEHIRMFGTLAPEQVAEFMEEYIDADTKQEIADLLDKISSPDLDVLESVKDQVRDAKLDMNLLAELRAILQDSFQEGDKAMDLLERIEDDAGASASELDAVNLALQSVQESVEKFDGELAEAVSAINDKLGL